MTDRRAENPRPFGGHIDIEGCEILGDAMPDVGDNPSLGITENPGIAVRVVGECLQRGGTPCRPADDAPLEIQKDLSRRPGTAVEQKCLARIKGQYRCFFCCRGRAVGRKIGPGGIGIENPPLPVGAEVVDVLMGKLETVQTLHGPGLRFGRE